MGKLTMYYSAMNGGKTTSLLQTAYNYSQIGMNVAIIKSVVDTKGGDSIVSRTGLERKVDILLKPNESLLRDYSEIINKAHVLLVDEEQFLTVDQVNELEQIAIADFVIVNCYGLRADFTRTFFPGSRRLFEIAELKELTNKPLCICGEIAEHNSRRVNGKFTKEGDQVVIDGETNVEYVPLCSYCYLTKVEGKEPKCLIKKERKI